MQLNQAVNLMERVHKKAMGEKIDSHKKAIVTI